MDVLQSFGNAIVSWLEARGKELPEAKPIQDKRPSNHLSQGFSFLREALDVEAFSFPHENGLLQIPLYLGLTP